MRTSDAHLAVRRANPVTPRQQRELELPPLDERLFAYGEGQVAHLSAAPPPPRRHPRLVLAAALAALAAVAGLLALAGGGSGPTGQPAFAATAIAVARANPRLLVTEPGWRVTRADEFSVDAGEVTFGDGDRELTVHWYPARAYRSYLRDRALVSRPRRSTLLGKTATTVRYRVTRGGAEFATMLSPQGPVFLEIRGGIFPRAEWEALLRSLRPVSVETWLAAMPPGVVRPRSRARLVARLLDGVPVPPSFDPGPLARRAVVGDRYHLAVEVAGAVSCAWVEDWLSATAAGDAAGARRAAAAMAGWHGWPVTRALEEGGPWAGNVRMAAEELASGNVSRGAAGEVVPEGGGGYALGPSWAVHLNCTDRYWRRPLPR